MHNPANNQNSQMQNNTYNPQGGTVAAQQQAPFMTYNQDEAAKASGSECLMAGGAYPVTIIKAAHGVSSAKGTQFLEFSCICESGEKANYIKVYYQKADGSQIPSGWNVIQSIMGLTGVRGLTFSADNDGYYCPEFAQKKVGMFLQKRLYTKNDGKYGFGFDLKLAFDPISDATMKEKLENAPVQMVQRMAENYADIDERTSQPSSNAGYQSGPNIGDNPF